MIYVVSVTFIGCSVVLYFEIKEMTSMIYNSVVHTEFYVVCNG